MGESLEKPKESKGGRSGVSPNQKSRQTSLPKDKDSFGAMLARAMGDKRSKAQMVRDREMNEKDEEEMGRNKGGAIKKNLWYESRWFHQTRWDVQERLLM